MKEEQDFDEGLKHVHEVILAGDVLKFVRENRSKLIGGERCEGGDRHKHQRADPADDHRYVNGVARQE